MRIGSLFSGYGGLDLAVAAHFGATVAWHVEFDKWPSAILAHHYPDIPNYGDVTQVDWAAVEPVDIITGGFPCQDVSHAGLRAGVHQGTRSGLWFEMARAIDVLKPWKVVIENVAGLLSADAASTVEPCPWCVGDEPDGHMRALGAVLADLAEMGLDARWGSVRAADAGAAHGRLRAFIVATDPARPRGDGAGASGSRRWAEPTDGGGDADGLTLLPTPAVNDMGAGKNPEDWDEWTAAMRAKHGNGNGHGKSLEIEAQRLLPTPTSGDSVGIGYATDVSQLTKADQPHRLRDAVNAISLLPTPTAKQGRNATAGRQEDAKFNTGTTLNDVAYTDQFGEYTAAIRRWEHIIGRPAPSPTEPGNNGRPRLSPRFVEWMMGLPDGWVTGVSGITRSAALKALGNGVVPQQAALALDLLDGA